jgi:Protein of unknown function (DUF4229)
MLTYNVWRLGLLGICLGIGYLAGLRGALWIVVALAVSGALSWFLLKRQREAMGLAVEQTVQRSRVKMMERTAAEDSYVDAVIASSAEAANPPGSSSERSAAAGDPQSS